jgi:hypothetical protein
LTLQPDLQAIANRGGPANLGSWSRIWRHGRSARQSIANFPSRRHVRDRGIPIHSPSSKIHQVILLFRFGVATCVSAHARLFVMNNRFSLAKGLNVILKSF